MGGGLIVEPYRSVVDALPGSRGDFLPQFGDRRSRMIIVASDKSLRGGETVSSAGLNVTVSKEVTGTFPL